MKKILLACLALAWASLVSAQTEPGKGQTLDLAEDTTQVTTISDIIEMQEIVSKSNSTGQHFSNVWGRKSFFNFGYNFSGSMNPKGTIPMPDDYFTELTPSGTVIPENVPDFKADWGLMLQLGHNYTLHKGAIANMVQINLDYTYIDLNMAHYKAEPYAKYYSTANYDKYDDEDVKGLPWAAEKYDLTYGMSLGPSITLAPFTMLNIRQLHYLKFNVYYHVGYNVGLLVMNQKSENDGKKSSSQLSWGHGLSQSIGFSVSWKSIGLGFESRKYTPTFKAIANDVDGSKSKFKDSFGRIYLTIRY